MTPTDLSAYIDAYHRTTGRLPRLRECVEHFEGRLLNVILCLTELPPGKADAIRQEARREREARKQAAQAAGQ